MYVKISKLKKIIFKIETNKENKLKVKKGAELVESILMTGITIALIVVVFYPQIMCLMTTGLSGMQTWFLGALTKIGQPLV